MSIFEALKRDEIRENNKSIISKIQELEIEMKNPSIGNIPLVEKQSMYGTVRQPIISREVQEVLKKWAEEDKAVIKKRIDILAQYYKEFHCSVLETLLKKEEDWDKFNPNNIIPKAVSFDEEEIKRA